MKEVGVKVLSAMASLGTDQEVDLASSSRLKDKEDQAAERTLGEIYKCISNWWVRPYPFPQPLVDSLKV